LERFWLFVAAVKMRKMQTVRILPLPIWRKPGNQPQANLTHANPPHVESLQQS
jgi:hypothetical protein